MPARSPHPGRFLTFALVNFEGIDDPDWGNREAKRLEEGFQAGARGLKFHKTFGLRYRPVRDVMLRASYATAFLPPYAASLRPPVLSPTPIMVTDPNFTVAQGNRYNVQRYSGGNPDLDHGAARRGDRGHQHHPGVRNSAYP